MRAIKLFFMVPVYLGAILIVMAGLCIKMAFSPVKKIINGSEMFPCSKMEDRAFRTK